MEIQESGRLLLRLAHALAATLWLGGGVYYLIALRPHARRAEPEVRNVIRAAQQEFGEWASVATLIMVATGVVLMFDRLTDGQGTTIYVVLLGLKLIAAVAAFLVVGSFGRRSRGPRGPLPRGLDRAWMALWLGAAAFVIGVVLATVYPTGVTGP